ncbi:MAG: hypothetical protein K2M42_00260 [Oscillospiraceae bacterium]|nr:hypothetical protein [Oscillospiraceae bacterium]
MKKKWPIHIMPMLLCLVMLFNIPAYAAETRASDRIVRSTVTLSKKSNGDLSIYFSVQANDIMEKIGATSVAIQRSSGNGWTTEYTFNTSNTPALLVENSDWHGMVLTYPPRFSGVEYRAVVMIYVKDAAGVSTQQLTS